MIEQTGIELRRPQLKNTVTVELLDKHGHVIQRESKANMMTNAIAYMMGLDMQDNYATFANEYGLLPLSSRGLGGIMLFDGTLTESPTNVLFPMNVHLIAAAGQTQDASNAVGGSLSPDRIIDQTAESQVLAWEFASNQANGTIRSIALTHSYFAKSSTLFDFLQKTGNYYPNISYVEFIAYDHLTGYAYFKDTYSSTNYVYVKRCKVPNHMLYCGNPNGAAYAINAETVLSLNTSDLGITNLTNSRKWHMSPDYDGYVYLVACLNFTDGVSATIYVKKYAASADSYSFDLVDDMTVTVAGYTIYGTNNTDDTYTCANRAAVSNGYLYIGTNDRKKLLKIKLSDSSVTEIDLDGYTLQYVYPMPGSGVMISTSKGVAIVYEDGVIVYSPGLSANSELGNNAPYMVDDLLMLNCIQYYGRPYFSRNMGYLGTICNLATPITKTVDNSLKVTYTLTNNRSA